MNGDDNFCGFPLRDIQIIGLHVHIEQIGDVLRLQLLDKKGVKWEIRPILFKDLDRERIPSSLSLYHRSNGEDRPMHYQKRSVHANYNGVKNIIQYIVHHERWENTTHKIKRMLKEG